MKFCRRCGMQLEYNDNWCCKCGANQNKEELPLSDFHSPIIHNNYLPKTYSITCIAGFILGIISIFF